MEGDTGHARRLRQESTDAERLLWRHLRNRKLLGHKFRRQFPIDPYVVDFVCLERRLVIELDGGQHALNAAIDAKRTAWLKTQGFTVFRFWNNQVLQQSDGVLESIRAALAKE